MTGSESTTPRFLKWWIVPTLAVLITGGVPLATASSASDAGRPGVRATTAQDPMLTGSRELLDRFVELWKERKLDELVAECYSDDAVMLPPNHEPIHGQAGILAFLKGVRDAVGDFDQGDYLIQATPSGDTVSWVGQYSFRNGRLRVTSHELHVRQPDGSMRVAVDMFGYRDPMS